MKKRTMLALLAAAPAVAFAQMGGKRRGGGDKGGAKGGGAPQINPLEATLGEFETDLKLAADQQKAWNAYADGIRALQRDIARPRAARVRWAARPRQAPRPRRRRGARPADGGGGHRRFGEGPPEDAHPRAAHDG